MRVPAFAALDPVIAAALAAGVLAAVCVLVFLAAERRRRRQQRTEALARRWQPHVHEAATPSARLAQPAASSAIGNLLPRQDRLRRRLLQTGRAVTIGQYYLGGLTTALLAAAAMTFGFGFSVPVTVAGAAVAGVALPRLLVDHLCRRRQRAFTEQFPEAIELIIRCLRTGLSVEESVASVASEMPGPVGPEFRRIGDAVRIGHPLEDALKDAVERIDTPEYRFFGVAIAIQRTTGGNLGETLANLADVLRKRRQMKQRIKAMASEPKASAWILGSLPFILFALILFVNSSYVMPLFDDPRGLTLIGAALISQGIGVVVMARMVRFEI